mmetsp:Transcript_27388/g.26452  ORF Transcript_27388/g.26452 Transcript_27388/m.26452 type:complete len:221 (-) Transcript_27388:20-682(-)
MISTSPSESSSSSSSSSLFGALAGCFPFLGSTFFALPLGGEISISESSSSSGSLDVSLAAGFLSVFFWTLDCTFFLEASSLSLSSSSSESSLVTCFLEATTVFWLSLFLACFSVPFFWLESDWVRCLLVPTYLTSSSDLLSSSSDVPESAAFWPFFGAFFFSPSPFFEAMKSFLGKESSFSFSACFFCLFLRSSWSPDCFLEDCLDSCLATCLFWFFPPI